MPDPEIVWTVLPRGIDTANQCIFLSVLVSPNLGTRASLPTDMVRWPEFVRNHQHEFSFVFNGGPPMNGAILQPPAARPEDSDAMWCRFFEKHAAREIRNESE